MVAVVGGKPAALCGLAVNTGGEASVKKELRNDLTRGSCAKQAGRCEFM
jgi:hypothetical protein